MNKKRPVIWSMVEVLKAQKNLKRRRMTKCQQIQVGDLPMLERQAERELRRSNGMLGVTDSATSNPPAGVPRGTEGAERGGNPAQGKTKDAVSG